jgi:photosystem II stability/assembly factor-like uncharacterized protein
MIPMTLNATKIRSFAVVALFAMLLAVPATARAADSLAWARTFAGPADIPNPNPDLAPIPVAGALNSVSFGDSDHVWAVGVRINNVSFGLGTRDSLVAYSADGGSTWSSGTAGVAVELHAVSAVSASEAWAVGDRGTIVHFSAGSWSRVTVAGWPVAKAFRGVAFADSLHGWAVGDGGGVVYTANGGSTWRIITAPGTGSALRCVTLASSTTAIAVGDAGLMRHLTATTSSSRSSGTGDDLYGVTFSDAGHAWAVGERATIVKSGDGGATWSAATRTLPGGRTLAELTMRSIAFSGSYTGIIVGINQWVWRTSDGGATWSPERLYDASTPDDYELRGVAFGGSYVSPVCVGRGYGGTLDDSDDKSRVYRGTWTGITPAPVTTSNAAPYYQDTATIDLTASVPVGGSDVAATYYTLNGGSQVESSTVRVTAVGTYALRFWSVDVSGTVEIPHSLTFTVAATPSSAGIPSAPMFSATTITHGRAFTVYGFVNRHTAGTSPIRLYFYRYKSGHWVSYKNTTAKVSDFLNFSRYLDSTSVPYAGTWRVRARNVDSGHSHYSAYKTFTVR